MTTIQAYFSHNSMECKSVYFLKSIIAKGAGHAPWWRFCIIKNNASHKYDIIINILILLL
jgi:hypothetical protein